MNEDTKVYVGLDVHKESIAIAQAAPGRGPARLVGEIGHDVNRLIKRLQALGKPEDVHIQGARRCGDCAHAHSPSTARIPPAPRDALSRQDGVDQDVWQVAGNVELRGCRQPDRCHRVRPGAAGVRRQSGATEPVTCASHSGLAIRGCGQGAVRPARHRCGQSAVGLVAEIGDIARFDHPRKLMGYLGLVPSEHSSGERINRGPLTKSGNAHARRLLTEAAWCYRFKPRVGAQAQRRQEDLT